MESLNSFQFLLKKGDSHRDMIDFRRVLFFRSARTTFADLQW